MQIFKDELGDEDIVFFKSWSSRVGCRTFYASTLFLKAQTKRILLLNSISLILMSSCIFFNIKNTLPIILLATLISSLTYGRIKFGYSAKKYCTDPVHVPLDIQAALFSMATIFIFYLIYFFKTVLGLFHG